MTELFVISLFHGENRVFSVLLIVCYSIPSGIFCAIPQKGKEIAELIKSVCLQIVKEGNILKIHI